MLKRGGCRSGGRVKDNLVRAGLEIVRDEPLGRVLDLCGGSCDDPKLDGEKAKQGTGHHKESEDLFVGLYEGKVEGQIREVHIYFLRAELVRYF
jgi:hypothetical protein